MKNILLARNAVLSAIIGSDTSLNDAARAIVGLVVFLICLAAYFAAGMPILLGGLYCLGYVAYYLSGWCGAGPIDQPMFVLIAVVFGAPLICMLMGVVLGWLLRTKSVQALRDRITSTRFWRWLDGQVSSVKLVPCIASFPFRANGKDYIN